MHVTVSLCVVTWSNTSVYCCECVCFVFGVGLWACLGVCVLCVLFVCICNCVWGVCGVSVRVCGVRVCVVFF